MPVKIIKKVNGYIIQCLVVEYSLKYGNEVCSTVNKFIIGEMEGMNVKVTNTF